MTAADTPDVLKQYMSLRDALVEERTKLKARIANIDKLLGEAIKFEDSGVQQPQPGTVAEPPKRVRNPISLRDAVVKLLAERPMTKKEILERLRVMGYQFTAKNPMNSLNALMYGRQVKFKVDGLYFSLPPALPSRELSPATSHKERTQPEAA